MGSEHICRTAKQDCKEETLVENIDSDRSHYLQSYAGSKFYDPMMVRNYEQPTVSSKLKRVQRSYYNRFNFRNIPFVVGTSISPSHNLGLNIQQVRYDVDKRLWKKSFFLKFFYILFGMFKN